MYNGQWNRYCCNFVYSVFLSFEYVAILIDSSELTSVWFLFSSIAPAFSHQHQSTSTYYVHLRDIKIWWIMHCAQNDNRFQVEIFPSFFALRKVFSSNRLKLNSFCFRLHSRSIGQSYERTQGFRLLQNNIQMWVQFWAEFHRTPIISGSVHVNRSNRENSEFILVHFLSSAFGNFDSKFHIYRSNNRLNL